MRDGEEKERRQRTSMSERGGGVRKGDRKERKRAELPEGRENQRSDLGTLILRECCRLLRGPEVLISR